MEAIPPAPPHSPCEGRVEAIHTHTHNLTPHVVLHLLFLLHGVNLANAGDATGLFRVMLPKLVVRSLRERLRCSSFFLLFIGADVDEVKSDWLFPRDDL